LQSADWRLVSVGEVRNTLLEFEMGLRSSSSGGGGSVRKITPVTTTTHRHHHRQQQQCVAETKQLPLQVCYTCVPVLLSSLHN